jgi:hypothetical protein
MRLSQAKTEKAMVEIERNSSFWNKTHFSLFAQQDDQIRRNFAIWATF